VIPLIKLALLSFSPQPSASGAAAAAAHAAAVESSRKGLEAVEAVDLQLQSSIIHTLAQVFQLKISMITIIYFISFNKN
jgi:hypothetical protein